MRIKMLDNEKKVRFSITIDPVVNSEIEDIINIKKINKSKFIESLLKDYIKKYKK